MGGYSTSQVASLTGVNAKTLHYWDRTGFFSPSIARAHGTGSKRLYSFSDLVALGIMQRLRGAGFALSALRRVVEFVRAHCAEKHPKAETFLITDGTDVYLRSGNVPISAFRNPGQLCMFFVVDLANTFEDFRDRSSRLISTQAIAATKHDVPMAG